MPPFHDPVRGWPAGSCSLTESARTGRRCSRRIHALMVVHDGLGSTAGSAQPTSDQLLWEIAGRLADSLRAGDTLAPVGPAEFALLVEVPTAEHPDCVAGRVVGSFRRPLPHGASTGG